MKVISENKRVKFDYEILDTIEAGLVLQGWEVKSIKSHNVSIENSFIKNKDNELFLVNAVVPKYKHGYANIEQDENRERKILLKKKEAKNLISVIDQLGNSAVAQKILNKNGLIKLIIAIVKGKKKFDKRNTLKEKDLTRRIEQDRKQFNY